ncbi:MAG TPA: hypothetical protein VIJ47_01910 [Acidimicrobiales bacterium]
MRAKPRAAHADFIEAWNNADRTDRRRVRRVVRVGRPVETAEDAQLAVGYAAFQRSRAWFRYFWFWFVPATLVAMFAALNIHPIVVGIVLAMAGNGLLLRWNIRRADKVNAALL